jgi:hypothetical protein
VVALHWVLLCYLRCLKALCCLTQITPYGKCQYSYAAFGCHVHLNIQRISAALAVSTVWPYFCVASLISISMAEAT